MAEDRTELKKIDNRSKKLPALFTLHLQEQKSAELSAEPDHITDSAQKDPFLAG